MAVEPYFTVEEFRTEHSDATEEKYSDERVEAARATAEEIIEGLDAELGTHQAFVPRSETFELAGGSRLLAIPRYRVRSIDTIAIGDEEQSLDGLFLEGSAIFGRFWRRGTIAVTVTHGWDAPPGRIREAALTLAYNRLVKGPIDDRATGRMSPEGSVITLAVPGMRGAVTGIPEVDAAIQQYWKPAIAPVSVSVADPALRRVHDPAVN